MDGLQNDRRTHLDQLCLTQRAVHVAIETTMRLRNVLPLHALGERLLVDVVDLKGTRFGSRFLSKTRRCLLVRHARNERARVDQRAVLRLRATTACSSDVTLQPSPQSCAETEACRSAQCTILTSLPSSKWLRPMQTGQQTKYKHSVRAPATKLSGWTTDQGAECRHCATVTREIGRGRWPCGRLRKTCR